MSTEKGGRRKGDIRWPIGIGGHSTKRKPPEERPQVIETTDFGDDEPEVIQHLKALTLRPGPSPGINNAFLVETILGAIRAGCYAHVAAAAAGINMTTFQRWMKRTEPEFVEFQAKVEQARAFARARAEVYIAKHKPDSWLMRGPGRDRPGTEQAEGGPGWTESKHVEVTGPNGGPVLLTQVMINLSVLSSEELREFERLAFKALPPAQGDHPSDPAGGDPSGEGET